MAQDPGTVEIPIGSEGAWTRIAAEGIAWNVEVLVAQLPERRDEIIGIRLEPPDWEQWQERPDNVADYYITSDSLRALPIAAIRKLASMTMRFNFGEDHTTPNQANEWRDHHYESVAKLYKKAFEAGVPTNQTIQKALNVSSATANRLIRGARDRGLLAWPKKRGVAGIDGGDESPWAKRRREELARLDSTNSPEDT